MLKVVPSKQFRKDIERAAKRGLDAELLNDVVQTLASEQPLDKKYKDHALTGRYKGFRECHVQPDWLLVYRVEKDILRLFLFRTGTHSDLF